MNLQTTASQRPLLRLLWILPALLFITAALSKSANPFSFLYELADYSFSLPIDLEAGLALFLPSVEVLLGMLLLFNGSRGAAIGVVLLLLIFSTGIVLGLPEGYLQRCGCLGPEDLGPGVTLAKNVLMLVFLVLGFGGTTDRYYRGNPWGAFALVAGGSWTDAPLILAIYGVCALLAALDGKKHLIGFAIGLILGLGFGLFGLPILLLPVMGAIYYFWKIDRPAGGIRPALIICFAVFVLTVSRLMYPPVP